MAFLNDMKEMFGLQGICSANFCNDKEFSNALCNSSLRAKRSNPKKNFRLISAFTLAEVLITLGIIVVIAALTIPNLIQESRNKELVSGYLKMHNTLSNGLKEMEAVEQMSFYKWGESDFKTKFEEHLKTTGCNANDGNFNPNVCLTDGSFFKYGTYDSECSTNEVCMELTIDTNGKKNPNQAGKDQFTLLLTKSGVKALGENESCSEGLRSVCSC